MNKPVLGLTSPDVGSSYGKCHPTGVVFDFTVHPGDIKSYKIELYPVIYKFEILTWNSQFSLIYL